MKTQSGIRSYGKALLEPGLWLDVLCCWLMAVGLSRAFDQLFDFHATWAQTLLFTLLVTVSLALLTRRAWLLPSLAGGCLLLTALLLTALRRLEPVLSYCAGFFDWWFQIFPPRSVYNTPENQRAVILLVQLAIACGVFFAVRRIRSVVVLGLTCLAFFTVVVLSGFRENIPAMAWILAGLLPLLARNTARAQDKASRPGSAAAQSGRRPKGRRMTPLWPVQLSAVAVCAVVSLLVGTLLPQNTTRWVSDSMQQWVGDLGDAPLTNGDLIRLPVELEEMGLADDASRLGGPLGERSDQVVLTMRSPQPLLLKSTAYQDYTGSGWTAEWDPEKSGAHDFDDSRYLVERLEAFDQDKPIPSNQYLFDQIAQTLETEITLRYNTRNLFVSGRVSAVNAGTGLQSNPLRYNNRGELFVNQEVTAPFTYSLYTQILPRTTAQQRQDLALLASVTYEHQLEDDLFEQIRTTYLQLPDGLPDRVKRTAQEAVKGKFTAYDKAEALETYLSENFRYTETPSEVPAGRDFVDYFLETGEGYCVYFASAMTVMARTLGIPARFVCGFGVERIGPQEYEARGYNSHAWVECYIQGIGWVTFDPTATSGYLIPGTGNTGNAPGGGDQQSSTTSWPTAATTRPAETTAQPADPSTTAPETQTSAAVSGGQTAPGPTDGGDRPQGLPVGVLLLILTLGALLLLIAAVTWRLKVCGGRCRLERVRQKYPGRSRQAEFYYQDFLRQVALLGYVPLANETMKQFAQRVLSGSGSGRDKQAPYPVPASAATVFRVIMDWRYGQQEPTDQEVAALASLREELEKAVRARCGAVKYFFCRRLGLGR